MIDSFGAGLDFAGRMGLNAGLTTSVGGGQGADLSAAASISLPSLASLVAITAPQAPAGTRLPDPLVLFRFKVEIDGIDGTLRFQKCSGPSIQTKPDVITSGGSPKHAAKMPGKVWKWDDVKLTRGIALDGDGLWHWVLDTIKKRRIDPHDITVTLLQPDGKEAMTWTFRNAYPKSWQISKGPDATSDKDFAVEVFTFTHQGADVVFPDGEFYPNTGAP